MVRGLFGLAVAAGIQGAEAGPFATVIKALEDASDDAKVAQQVSDDEFTKVQCKAQELIDDSNKVIPEEKANIEKYVAKLEQLRADNEEKSIEIADLRASVAKDSKELAQKTKKRNAEAAKFKQDKKDMEAGMASMDMAIKLLMDGTANFLQVRDNAFDHISASETLKRKTYSLMQTGSKMKTSGQIIGVLNSMKDTFTENLADMTAEENLAIKYFTGYKERTENKIATEKKLIKEKQAAVKGNSEEIAVTVTALKTSRETLAEKEEQLRVQTAHLAEHTKFHDQLTQETLALLESIQNAVDLLSSPEALKTMAKSEEHMTAVSFLQTPHRAALLEKQAKGANDYSGWQTIYDAINDMTSALNEELAEDNEMFENCESEVKSHLANERDLKAKYTEDMALKASTEEAIDTAKNTIKTSEDTIAAAQKTIQDTMDNLNQLIKDTDREIAEGKAATKLFNEAIAMLSTNTGKEMGVGPEDDDDTTAEASYDTSKIKEGTSRVTAIIEKVRDDMNKEIDDMVKDNKTTMKEYRDLVDSKNDEIETAEGELGKAQQTLADSKTSLAGIDQRLKYTNEGLASELKWWGDENSGTNLDTRGQECIKWLGREEFSGHGDRTVPKAAGYTATDKISGDGLYHSKTTAKNNEVDSIGELKTMLKGLETQYKTPQTTL